MSSSKKSIAEQPKGDRELRASRRIDYKLMNSGNTGFELAQDSQSGTMAAGFGGTIDDAPFYFRITDILSIFFKSIYI